MVTYQYIKNIECKDKLNVQLLEILREILIFFVKKKICKNSEVIPKVGSVVIKGIHKDSVTLWLSRLGF